MTLLENVPPRLKAALPFAALAALVLLMALTHRDLDGEAMAYRPFYLQTIFGAQGPNNAINGHQFHYEGTVILENARFFSGAGKTPFFEYEIATNRMLYAMLVGSVGLLVNDLYFSMVLVNLLAWYMAVVALFLLGRDVLGSLVAGMAMAVLAATSHGFTLTWLGTKGHLFSYAYFFLALYLFERLDIFRRRAPWPDIAIAGLVIGLGTFANNLQVVLTLYCLFRGGWPLGLMRLAALAGLALLPLTLFKTLALRWGASFGDRTDVQIALHVRRHLEMFYQYYVEGKAEPIKFARFAVDNPWHPLLWIPSYFKSVFKYLALPLWPWLVAGLPMLRRRGLALVLGSFAAPAVAVCLAQTYWPYWEFMGYASFYVSASFIILGGMGVDGLHRLAGAALRRMGGESAVRVAWVLPALALALVVFLGLPHAGLSANLSDIVNFYCTIISHRYPHGWDFDIFGW